MSSFLDLFGDDVLPSAPAVDNSNRPFWIDLLPEQRIESLVESLVDGVLVIDDFGRIRKMNRGAEIMFGWTFKELQGLDFSILIPDDLTFDYVGRLEQFRSNGSPSTARLGSEFLARHRDGTLVPIEVGVKEVAGNRENLMFITIRDLSRVKMMQKALERVSRVTDASSELILLLFADGTVFGANSAAQEYFGLSIDSLGAVTRDSAIVSLATLVGGDRERSRMPVTMAAQAGETVEDHMILRNASGFERDFAVQMISHTDPTGAVEFISFSARDVSDRIAAAQAHQMSTMKDRFVSTVSHELRTPLTSVIGALRLLESGALGVLSTDTESVIRLASDNARFLMRLINDLLDLSINSAPKTQVTKVVVIGDLIEEAIATVRSIADEKSVPIMFVRLSVADIEIVGAPDRLRQVLVNLLNNAIKFSNPRSPIDVVVDSRDRDMVVISIVDQGCGIPAERLDDIFEPFSQVSEGVTRESEGFGLGLSISRSIVEAHGGEIWVRSVEGGGSTFSFSLPVRRSHES